MDLAWTRRRDDSCKKKATNDGPWSTESKVMKDLD